eukprot:scaffold56373_cov21-Tisochrysis_lutea.AAC.1
MPPFVPAPTLFYPRCLSVCRVGGTLALGMLVTLASVVYAAFRAGSNSSLFTLEGSEEDEGQEQ